MDLVKVFDDQEATDAPLFQWLRYVLKHRWLDLGAK